MFGNRKFPDKLAEEEDPDSFPSEKARERSIRFDRWAGRHRGLTTLLMAALMAVGAYFAWERVFDGRGILLLVIIEVVFVAAAAGQFWRLATRARRRYHGK